MPKIRTQGTAAVKLANMESVVLKDMKLIYVKACQRNVFTAKRMGILLGTNPVK